MEAEMDMEEKTNEIWVNKFDEESAQKFRDRVVFQSKSDPNKPIIVYIDSYGGHVDALAKMIGTMDEVSNPIVTVCLGKAMSCGAILLSHGDVRFCDPYSRVMIHEVSSGTSGDVHDMAADAHETKRINELFLGLLAKNCGYAGGYTQLRKFIKDKDGRDIYMNANMAKEFGIVDIIGLPKVGSTLIHDVSIAQPKSKIIKRPDKHQKKSKTDSKKSVRVKK